MPIVRKTRRAHSDLREIWRYIAVENHNPLTATNFLRKIDGKLQILAQFPHLGPAYPEIGPDVRIFPAGDYIIQYIPTDDGVKILRIVHGYRESESLS